MVFALSAPVDVDPLIAWLPDQPPDALQAVAWVLDQVTVELLPLAIVVGLATRLTVGAGDAGVTDTVADWVALPPVPVHVST